MGDGAAVHGVGIAGLCTLLWGCAATPERAAAPSEAGTRPAGAAASVEARTIDRLEDPGGHWRLDLPEGWSADPDATGAWFAVRGPEGLRVEIRRWSGPLPVESPLDEGSGARWSTTAPLGRRTDAVATEEAAGGYLFSWFFGPPRSIELRGFAPAEQFESAFRTFDAFHRQVAR